LKAQLTTPVRLGVNGCGDVLDPEVVVLGGELGLAGGSYRAATETGFRTHLWSSIHAPVPILPAKLGADAGLVGAAFASQID
jgi:glucokinase